MATHQSNIIEAKNKPNISDKAAVDGEDTGALVLHATAVYKMKATEVSNDIIELTDLPPGATVIPQDSFVAFGYPAAFASGTLHLGDVADPTRYGQVTVAPATAPGSGRFGYVSGGQMALPEPYKKGGRLVAKFNGTPTSRVANGLLVFGIAYRIRG